MIKIFKNSFQVLKRIKPIILIVFILTLISLGVGFYLSQSDSSIILSVKNNFLSEIKKAKPIQDILRAIMENNILYAIFYTAIYNTIFGAFLSTTLLGIIFPIPVIVMVERGLFVGLLYGDIQGNYLYYLLMFGTIVFEFGAYVLSSSLGINIGLSIFWPKRFHTNSRWQAFKIAWLEAFQALPLIVVILFISAIWEIGGLYLLM